MLSRPRIVVASPHAAESTAIADWLASEGFEPIRVANVERTMDEVRDRAFDVLLVDYGFAFGHAAQPIGALRARNAKTPIVVLGERDAAAESQALARGAMYVARPLDQASLVCTVSMAVMESRPERRSLRKRVNRLDAVVDGVPSHIIDISREGLRVEVPRGRRSAPPPIFTVKVPMLGVALLARRMWTCGVPEASRDAVWYGAELSGNPRRVELAWISLVDTIPAAGTAIEVQ